MDITVLMQQLRTHPENMETLRLFALELGSALRSPTVAELTQLDIQLAKLQSTAKDNTPATGFRAALLTLLSGFLQEHSRLHAHSAQDDSMRTLAAGRKAWQRLLGVVVDRPLFTAKEVSERSGMDKGQVSRTLEEMREHGFVEQPKLARRPELDTRHRPLRLTAKGRRLGDLIRIAGVDKALGQVAVPAEAARARPRKVVSRGRSRPVQAMALLTVER